MLMLPTLMSIAAASVSATAQPDRGGMMVPVSQDMCTTPAHWSPPFTQVYQLRNGATVIFVAVEHSQDLNDPTHRQIKAAFDAYKPGFVLVEGTSSTKSNFDWYRKLLADDARRRTDAGSVPENLYAIRLAVDRDAQYAGWDFSPDQDYQVLRDDKFTMDDAVGAHLLRSHVDPFDTDRVPGEVTRQLRYASMVQPIASFDYTAWYRKAYGDRYDPAAGTPCGHGIAGHVVKALSYRRNLNMVGLIDDHALPGQALLIEAGANHWLAVKDWLSSRSTNAR